MRSRYPVRFVVITGLFMIGLLASGCGRSKQAGPPPSAGPLEVSVVTIQPQRVTITTELTGRTSAYLVAEVRPQVSGIVQKRLFTEGSDVQAGDVLYQIDSATYQAAYDSAKAVLGRAEANLIPIRLKEERYRELVSINAVSKQDYDETVGDLRKAEAEIEVSRAAMEAARINLAYCQVKAPISGRIGKSSVTTGALVTANQQAALATIQKLDPMYVDVTQSSAELLRLKHSLTSGQLKRVGAAQAKVKLLLEDGTSYPREGTLKFSDVTVDPGTGSVTLRSVFPNPDHLLLPGMFVRAIVQEGVDEQAILVPQRAVTRNPAGQAMVMLVSAEEKVEARVIKTDRTIGDAWLVNEGLSVGDRVILEGTQKVRPGTPVKTVPFGNPPGNASAGAPPSAGTAE